MICATSRAGSQTAAPFLQCDADPYPVVINGRIVWVLDGYTTTNQYPYSQSTDSGHRQRARATTSTTSATR